jgi:hypothetical protein
MEARLHPREYLSDATKAELAQAGLVANNAGTRAPGYFSETFGYAKPPRTAAQVAASMATARAAKAAKAAFQGTDLQWRQMMRDKRQDPAAVAVRLQGAVKAAVRKGLITGTQANQVSTIRQLHAQIARKNQTYAKDAKGRFVTDLYGVRGLNTSYVRGTRGTRASAYDLKRLLGVGHTKKVAQLLSFLGPASIQQFIAFHKNPANGYADAKNITQTEVADFATWALTPWMQKNQALAAHWATPIGKSDLASLRAALEGF